ncbi:hypothetical protein niasHT_018633 [Heterodera trifolii]|uniref:Metalloendopeptidase n=1 Tax=Heterodera trifolii TaxID=157864 RepID=A0ABD2KZ27_9BILA
MNCFLLLTFFLSLVFNCSAPPIRPLSSDVGIWKKCNGKNGIIMVENDCTKLLICYQSEMAKNSKIGKRIGCLSQSLVAPKTKAPFVGTAKFRRTTPRPMPKTTFGIVPTTEQTFAFVPFARNVDHFGTNCTNIFFPTEVNKFLLNITATPYEIACNDYEKRAKMYEPIPSGYWSDGRFVNACMAVPSAKCEKHVELYACYESIGNKPSVNAIGELCQKHLNNATNAAGFAVQICAHRHQIEETNELINDGIGSILKDIAPQIVNGTLAKMIHFVPPSNDDKMLPFFQIERPKFSKFITNDTDLLPYQNDPNKFNRPDPCDKYGTDCVPIRNLLLKIEALANCGKNESKNNAIFEMPGWAPPLPPAMPWKKRSETMLCGGDMFCDKRRLHEQYNRLRKICGLQPEKVESQRKKRQYDPNEKWIENPIKITFNKKALPDKYGLWDNAIRVGAKLIEEVTCVRFEFVDEMMKRVNGIKIENTLKACGASPLGRASGWQFLMLGMTNDWCIADFNMSVVAGHELMHALGFDHEQSRSDGRNYVILREDDGQSEIDPYTRNFGFAYDFGSVLHYRADGDHEQGLYDLITLPRFYQQTIGQHERISFKDAAIINRIYCKNSCNGTEDKCENGGYLNPNDCTKCHCPDGYGGEYCKELEKNLNCEDLSGIPRELVAKQSAVLLKAEAKCGGNGPCRCHWQIKPEAGKKAQIQFKSLSNLFECTYNCSSAYVEVKYRADKRAQGAKLCCAASLTDLNANEYKNWIEAEKPDTDIVISARLSPKWTVNGIQINGSRQRVFNDPKDPRHNLTRIELDCYKAEAGTVSFWGYSKPETKEIIRVDEIHCLHDYAVAGVPERFKNLQVEEQPPMKLSPNPLSANASSLIHVFVPFVGHP